MASQTQQIKEFEQTLRDTEGQEAVLQSMGLQRVRHGLATEQQQQTVPQHLVYLYCCITIITIEVWSSFVTLKRFFIILYN